MPARLFLWLFWWMLAILWFRYTLRTFYLSKVLHKFYSYENQAIIVQEGRRPKLALAGAQILFHKSKRVMRAVVKFTSSAGEVHPASLSSRNFSVREFYWNREEVVSVLKVAQVNVPVYAALLVDGSESMLEPSGIPRLSKMAVAKQAVSFFIDRFTANSDNRVAVLPFFGDGCSSRNFLKARVGEIWSAKVSKQVLKRKVNGIQPAGGTPLWSAVSVALNQLDKIKGDCYKVVIVLSDGMNTDETLSYSLLQEQMSEIQVPIFTLCYGEPSKTSPQALIHLSSYSGAGEEQVGSFIDIHPKDWAVKLGGIGQGLSRLYEVHWKGAKLPPGTQIEVICNVWCEVNRKRYKTQISSNCISS